MVWLQDVISRIWQVFALPHSVAPMPRLLWSLGVLAVVLWLGVLIGQAVFGKGSGAFYPKERFRIALAWSFLGYGSFLTVMTATGWWFAGQVPIGALSLHILLVVASLAVVFACLPSVPRQVR